MAEQPPPSGTQLGNPFMPSAAPERSGGARGGTPSGAARWKRALGLGVGLLVVGASLVYALGAPRSRVFMDSNAGLSLTLNFWVPVRDAALEWDDGRTSAPAFAVVPRDPDGAAVGSESVSFLLPESELSQRKRARFTVWYGAFGLQRSTVVEFDPVQERVQFVKNLLAGMPGRWVSFSAPTGRPLLYFTSILVYKYVLREVRWGWNDEPLNRRVRFSPATAPRAGVGEGDELYVDAPPGLDRVRVQLVFLDGSRSAVETILRADATGD